MIFWLNRVLHWIKMVSQTVRYRWVPELEKLSDNVEKLKESLAGTDDCLLEMYGLEERHDERITTLEEELAGVKAENVEMRNHFNAMIKELNAITAFINEKHGSKIIEQTFELDTPPPNKGYHLRSYKL